MNKEKLDKAFGINNIEIDSLMNEAESDFQKDMKTFENEEQVQKFNQQRQEIEQLKTDVKSARGMKNRDWANGIIQKSVENAILAQQMATHDIENDFRSNKLQALGELTNAIIAGAKAVVEMEHGEQTVMIQAEKNQIRKKELEGRSRPTLDMKGEDGEIIGIGSSKDILALLKKGIDPTKGAE